MESVEEALSKVLGDESAKCVSFYVDPHIAVSNPEKYARSMLKMFGMATKVLLDTILEFLHEKTGTQKSAGNDFGAEIESSKRAFNSSSST